MPDPIKTIILDGSWRRDPVPEIPRSFAQAIYPIGQTPFIEGPPGPTGPVGNSGPPGPVGPQGLTGRSFGAIDYSDLDTVIIGDDGSIVSGTPLPIPGGQWTPVVRNLTPSPANPNLPTAPWDGFAFWDGARLRARKIGDLYHFKFTYRIVAAQRNSVLRFAVRPDDNSAFDFGPQPIMLGSDAGVPEIGSETFWEIARSRFATKGAAIYAYSDYGATLLEFSPEIAPWDYVP